MYELIEDGQIEVIKVGTATLVPVESLRRRLHVDPGATLGGLSCAKAV